MTKSSRRSRVTKQERRAGAPSASPSAAPSAPLSGPVSRSPGPESSPLHPSASPSPSPSLSFPDDAAEGDVSAAASALFDAVDDVEKDEKEGDTRTPLPALTFSGAYEFPTSFSAAGLGERKILKPKGRARRSQQPQAEGGPAPAADVAPPAESSTATTAASASQPAFRSTLPTSAFTFKNDESAKDPFAMAADVERRLAYERNLKTTLEKYFEGVVAEKDSELTQLKQDLQDLKRQLGELRATGSTAEQHNNALQQQLTEQHEEMGRLQANQASVDSVKREYGVYKAQHEKDLASRTRENQALRKQIEQHKWESVELQAKAMDAQKDMNELKKQEVARAAAFETNAQAKADLSKTLTEFEAIFPDMGKDLFIDDYIIAVRNLKAFYAQKEEEARNRESSEEGTGQVSSSSIQDELQREGYDSNAESEGGDYDSDEDPTLQSLGLTAPDSTKPQRLSFSNIVSVDSIPVQSKLPLVTSKSPKPQHLSLSDIVSVDSIPVQSKLPPVISKLPKPRPTLSFSKITSVSIGPPPIEFSKEYLKLITGRVRFKFSKPVSVETTPIPFEPQIKTVLVPTAVYKTPTYTQMWHGAAWHIKLFIIAAFVLFMSLNVMLAHEYYIWIKANDITRQYIFDITSDHYENLLPSPFILSIGEYLGIDFTILG